MHSANMAFGRMCSTSAFTRIGEQPSMPTSLTTRCDAVGVTLRNIDDTTFASRSSSCRASRKSQTTCVSRAGAPVIVGGSGFSIMPEDVLAYCRLDLGIVGDGEDSLPSLVQKLAAGEDYTSVPGLVYRDAAGFRRNAPGWRSLDAGEVPGRSAVDNRRYLAEGGMGSIESKRGCSGACIYCVDAQSKGRRSRCRSPQSVVAEMEALLGQGIDCLHFCDAEFNLPASHADDVCREMIRKGLGEKLGWYAYASPAPFDGDTAALYCKAGCRGINFGVDSADDEVLRILGRDFDVQDLRHTAAACHEQGLVFMYDLLLGGPGETKESLSKTIHALKQMSPDRVGAALGIRVFPGTRLAELVLQSGPFGIQQQPPRSCCGQRTPLQPVVLSLGRVGRRCAAVLGEADRRRPAVPLHEAAAGRRHEL